MTLKAEVLFYIAWAMMLALAVVLILSSVHKQIDAVVAVVDTQATRIEALETAVMALKVRLAALEKNQELCAWMERGE